jgi:hypothetical protein
MKIVKIKPLPCFCNGDRQIVTAFNVTTAGDNLEDTSDEASVTFIFRLFNDALQQVAEGKKVVTGAQYHNWDSTSRDAYRIVAELIEVEFVNETTRMFEVV